MSPRSAALPYVSSAKTAMTTGKGASSRFVHSTVSTTARSIRSFQMKRMPSASSERKWARSFSSCLVRGPGDEEADERCREEEARRVEPERVRRAERGHHEPADGRAEEHRELLDAASDTARALHRHAGELDEVGQDRRPRGRSRRVQERAQEHEREELPELDADGRVEEGDRRDGPGARQVGDDARRAEPEAVHDHTAEERREDDAAGS